MSNQVATKGLDSKIIGEIPSEADVDIALINADMSADGGFDISKVRDRAKIGRFAAADAAGYILANTLIDRESLEKVQRRLLADMDLTKDARTVVSIAEAMKNIVNTSVAVQGVQLKAVEIMAYGRQKKSKQTNAPQAVITGANPQIVMTGNPVATPQG